MEERRALLGQGRGRDWGGSARRPAAFAAATGCVALLALSALSGSYTHIHGGGRTELAVTTTTTNCDGSVDITTTDFMPCAPTLPGYPMPMMPTVTSSSYYVPQVPVAPVAPMAPPVGNVYQYPTVWSGAHVVSGGQPEWAEEDSALHALTLANWRIKLLEARKKQTKLQKDIMKVGSTTVTIKTGSKAKKSTGSKKEIEGLKKEVSTLAEVTRDAMKVIQKEVSSEDQKNRESLSSMSSKVSELLNDMKDLQ